jgi:hypothetical protein
MTEREHSSPDSVVHSETGGERAIEADTILCTLGETSEGAQVELQYGFGEDVTPLVPPPGFIEGLALETSEAIFCNLGDPEKDEPYSISFVASHKAAKVAHQRIVKSMQAALPDVRIVDETELG